MKTSIYIDCKEISKDNNLSNLWVLCKKCHAKKTYHKDKNALWGVNN